ncbi:MAG TPA: HAMP domain-containing sensor histidine kinase [Streptosporangiaceae bacterium]
MMIRGLRRGQPGTNGRRKLRTKVVAGVVAITLAVLALFDFAAVTALKKYLFSQTDVTLQSALTVTKPRLNQLLPAFAKARVVKDGGVVQWSSFPIVGAYTIEWVPAKGAVVDLQGGAGLTPPAIAKLNYLAANQVAVASANGKSWTVSDGKGQTAIAAIHAPAQFRMVSMAVPGQAGTLVAGTNLSDVNNTVRQLELIVGAGSAAAAVLIFLGVGLVMRRGLRPIEQMAYQADRISAGDLTERVAPTDSGTEVGRLGTALNGMLGRIQTSVAEREASQDVMRSFFADASHELRTPLASLCANAELYQQGALVERSQVDEAMHRITLEAQRMSRLVDDMLRLARLDQHPDQRRDLVDLTALVGQSVDRAQVADPARTWQAEIEPGLAVAGDEEQLSRAVDNLLANVQTHTPEGTVATVTAHRDGSGRVVVEVTDDGPGVPADKLPRIFDRFYRAGGSRRIGSGLGLAIVSQIAAAHQGVAMAAANYPRGLRVTLTLPAWRWK